MRERCLSVRVLFSKLIQTPPRNNVHLGGETLAETFSGEKPAEGASREGRTTDDPPSLKLRRDKRDNGRRGKEQSGKGRSAKRG